MNEHGWRDSASTGLETQKIGVGFGDRTDICVFSNLTDVEEGGTP
jgi:hypothetical protein